MGKIVILIPTYNEAQNIAPLIARVRGVRPEISILVVDDNSPDGTAQVVRGLMASDPHLSLLSREGKEGLGKAYLCAFSEVLRDPSISWIQMMDADFSHDPNYLPDMFAKTDSADLVLGSRYVSGGGTVGWTWWRRVLSRGANLYCRVITGMPINDATSGYILMRTDMMRGAHLEDIRAHGHAFMMELKHRLWKAGARIAEIPVLLEDRQHGSSKITRGVLGEAALAPWKMRFLK
ncbi:MAG TPA: polyprenol monophosphomannose synthase [Candidatus Paceibacterota bacterium]|nr:polyprenol monophosphomannose synthase [Candidatus Paceibacterota bacterium]